MFCRNCGSPNQDGKYCANCGNLNFNEKPINSLLLQPDKNLLSKSSDGKSTSPETFTKLGFVNYLGIFFGLAWIITGLGIISDPECSGLMPVRGSRFALVFECTTEGSGAQFFGFLFLLIGIGLIVFNLRKLIWKSS
jgi:membrane-bound ClpP family serine protease